MDNRKLNDDVILCRRKRTFSELINEAHQISVLQRAVPNFLSNSEMFVREEIFRICREFNPSCAISQSIANTNDDEDSKVTAPTNADAQKLSEALVENMNRALHCITNAKRSSPQAMTKNAHQHTFTLNEKVPIPKSHGRIIKGLKCNLIGRIIGPAGMSLRQLESDTGCQILVRGKGSIKDPRREQRLRGRPGYENLEEPLHVLVTAVDHNHNVCQQKLRRGVERIRHLLKPAYDDYKRDQLIQLAIINGTYREVKGKGRKP